MGSRHYIDPGSAVHHIGRIALYPSDTKLAGRASDIIRLKANRNGNIGRKGEACLSARPLRSRVQGVTAKRFAAKQERHHRQRKKPCRRRATMASVETESRD